MKMKPEPTVSRRRFIQSAALASAGLALAPRIITGAGKTPKPFKRAFGRLNFEVTTLGLGGQASLQWTPEGIDPVKIILKAHALGVNYFDTSNLYGPSQMNYGKAFRELNLVPGVAGYSEKKRSSIFLTSKTNLRWAKGGWKKEGLRNATNGTEGSVTLDDVRRTLTQVFGDGNGDYPPGAYLDMVLIHNLSNGVEVDALYEGLEKPDPRAEHIGALAALLDVRDGTNRTGLNPKEEKLIRHIGFSGHRSPAVMMEMIQRDGGDILDAMLVAVNANDLLNFNMQFNILPVASAKNMGIIAMKVFADGAMYTKEAAWTRRPDQVVRTVGSDALPSAPLVQYALTTPGVHTAIIGTGQISDDPKSCQLERNRAAAQIDPDGLSESDRVKIENSAAAVKDGKTNYFQLPKTELGPPREPALSQANLDGRRVVRLEWQTAYAGDKPISHYEIRRDGKPVSRIRHRPQTGKTPFVFDDGPDDRTAHEYHVVTVDSAGRIASTGVLTSPSFE